MIHREQVTVHFALKTLVEEGYLREGPREERGIGTYMLLFQKDQPSQRTVAGWLIGSTVGPLKLDGRTRRVKLSRSGLPDKELSWAETSFPVLGDVYVPRLSWWQRLLRFLGAA